MLFTVSVYNEYTPDTAVCLHSHVCIPSVLVYKGDALVCLYTHSVLLMLCMWPVSFVGFS